MSMTHQLKYQSSRCIGCSNILVYTTARWLHAWKWFFILDVLLIRQCFGTIICSNICQNPIKQSLEKNSGFSCWWKNEIINPQIKNTLDNSRNTKWMKACTIKQWKLHLHQRRTLFFLIDLYFSTLYSTNMWSPNWPLS